MMENKKVFIGNLDFSATEAELKSLLSKFGSVASVQLKQKKGNAIIEMENADAAAQAVQQLEGTKYKDREIRASLFMKARRARSVSVRNYKERGANLARKSAERPNASQRPHLAAKPSHSGSKGVTLTTIPHRA
jgi:RNA recognition motif-containing protein